MSRTKKRQTHLGTPHPKPATEQKPVEGTSSAPGKQPTDTINIEQIKTRITAQTLEDIIKANKNESGKTILNGKGNTTLQLLRRNKLKITSLNTSGKIDEIINYMKTNKIYIMCTQESMFQNNSTFYKDDYFFITATSLSQNEEETIQHSKGKKAKEKPREKRAKKRKANKITSITYLMKTINKTKAKTPKIQLKQSTIHIGMPAQP